MGMLRNLLLLLYVAVIFCGCPRWLHKTAKAQSSNFSVENSRKVGSLIVDNGVAAGSCFYVDERGYVATCLSNLRSCKEAFVQFDTQSRLRVSGIVAASRGRDIAILQLIDVPREDPRFQKGLELRPDTPVELGEELVAWGGFKAVRAPQLSHLPKVVRILQGDEFCLGMRGLTGESFGCQQDTRWLWLSQARHPSCNGAPVFNQTGHVVAMLSAGPNQQSEVFSAIHIQHVLDLIPKDDPKPKSLKIVKSWIDPLPSQVPTPRISANAGTTGIPSDIQNALGGACQHGWPLAERYTALQRRAELALFEKTEIEQTSAAGQEDQLELLAEANKIQSELTGIVPEEQYKTTEKDRETVRGKDGKEERRTTTRDVIRLRHSPRQLAQIASLRPLLTAVESKLQLWSLRFNYDTKVRLPFVNQIISRNEQAFFFLADPLCLRPKSDHVSFAAELTKVIEAGGAQGAIYLARGMCRIRLGDYQGATADLKESYDIDTKFRPLARALHARIVGLQGAADKASATVKSLIKDEKSNPRLFTIAARIELDAGSAGAAARYLQQAHELMPDELELKHGLAWVLSAGSGTNSKLAFDVATSAVEWTGYQDWSCMAALANVHAWMKKPEMANQAINTATQLTPQEARAICDLWRAELTAGRIIKRNWK